MSTEVWRSLLFWALSVCKYISMVKGLCLYSDSGVFVMGKFFPFEDKWNGLFPYCV